MLQDEQLPIDREIGKIILLDIKPEWSKFYLEVENTVNSQKIVIQNIQNGEMAVPSDNLMIEVRKLFLLYKRHQISLHSIKYIYTKQTDGKWNFVSNYVYDD